MKTQNQLYLVLSKPWFQEILNGTKKEEYRAFTDFYISRLAVVDDEGCIVDTKTYDTVKFQMGYGKNAPQMVVKVKRIRLDIDEDVDLDAGDLLTADNCNFTIELGKILETSNC
ncbi:ASCH domain-containing protein [Riemerella columbina]|uniref:ASCH domain-containing protein n=1 Tax=Riemerella columbina TaxID=103810 RepID=UPI00266F93CD|nr:ASCH domain-containing protein [Riemerella columbina]WKS95347.1 ASCH domain-containing protein [Riemerella columbina]